MWKQLRLFELAWKPGRVNITVDFNLTAPTRTGWYLFGMVGKLWSLSLDSLVSTCDKTVAEGNILTVMFWRSNFLIILKLHNNFSMNFIRSSFIKFMSQWIIPKTHAHNWQCKWESPLFREEPCNTKGYTARYSQKMTKFFFGRFSGGFKFTSVKSIYIGLWTRVQPYTAVHPVQVWKYLVLIRRMLRTVQADANHECCNFPTERCTCSGNFQNLKYNVSVKIGTRQTCLNERFICLKLL